MGFQTNDGGPGCNAKTVESPYHDVRYVAAENEQDAANRATNGQGRHSLAEAIADCDERTTWDRFLGRPSSPFVYAVELVVRPVSRET